MDSDPGVIYHAVARVVGLTESSFGRGNMNTDQIQALMAVVQSVLALLSIVASFFVYAGTVRIAKAQFFQTLSTSWNTIDSTLLAGDQNLRVANALIFDKMKGISPDDVPRKRWVAFMMLNPLEIAYEGVQKNLLDKALAAKIEHNLRQMLEDDEVFLLSQQGIYLPPFAALCARVKAELRAEKKSLQV